MTKLFTLFVFFALVISTSVFSQNLTITKHDLSAFHGSPTSTYFAEDADGNIWALQWGSFPDDHILKYDGSTWTQVDFSECDHCARRIIADNNGKIFLSTSQAIYSYNGTGWDLETGSNASDSDIDFDSDNALWFYDPDDDELNEYRNGVTQFYSNVTGPIHELTVATNDRKWMRIDGVVKEFSIFGLTEHPEFNNPLHIEAAPDGKVWITNAFGEIGYYDNGTVETNALTGVTISGLPHTTFAIDPNYGFFWFGQQGSEAGLVFYDGASSTLVLGDDLFDDPFAAGLPNNAFVASDGSVWVAHNFISDVAQVTPEISSVFEPGFEEVALFPNPATSEITLEFAASNQFEVEVEIHDQIGRLVKSTTLSPSGNALKINVEDLHEGLYFIKVPEEKIFGRFVKK